jgi:two-component system, OmpR family, response regulator
MSGVAVVIEDDDAIGEVVMTYLEQAGYEVVRECTGERGLAAVDRRRARFVVLDLGLPDIDGFDLCRRIRAGNAIPILILTARDEEADRVIGLELGADDYITKPFSPRELVARVRAVLRRLEPQPEAAPIAVGELRVDLRTRSATLRGSPLALRTLEFDLLAELARNEGNVVTRDQLLDRVWGVSFAGGTRTVDVHVSQLRKKLGRADLIQTVRGLGYRLVERDV